MENKAVKKHDRTIQGIVVSDIMDKTVVIAVRTRILNPAVKKFVRQTKKFKVHDEKNEAKMGDVVLAKETRPLSRDKRHVLLKIVTKATI